MYPAGSIDIGGTNTRVALVDPNGVILAKNVFHTPVNGLAEDIPKMSISALMALAEVAGCRLAGIGIAVAGPVDTISGSIVHPPNLPFDIVPVSSYVKLMTGFDVCLLNDCRAAVIGEVTAGGGRGFQTVVYITISTGIGGGVYANKRLLYGRNGNAGEIGHFPVDSIYNMRCTCGGYGHWEGYCSGRTIPIFYKEWIKAHHYSLDLKAESAEKILDAANMGEEPATGFCTDLSYINSRGLSAVIVAYDPDCIIFDGAVMMNHPWLLEDMIKKADRYLKLPKIELTTLNGNAPLIGAAMGVFHPEMLKDS